MNHRLIPPCTTACRCRRRDATYRLTLILLAVLGLSACSTTPDSAAGIDAQPAGPLPQAVEIFYATNRSPAAEPGAWYGADRGMLAYGIARVGIPPNHRIGRYEEPSVFRFEWDPDERKHISLQAIEELDLSAFLSRMRAVLNATSSRKVMLFVHGYNVDFPLAARRLAQFATDLKFDGPVLLFSWPSQGTLTGYTRDETNVEWSQVDLTRLISQVLDNIDCDQVILVAHSMGTRAVTRAYRNVLDELPENIRAPLNEMILVAPDIDADLFRDDFAPSLVRGTIRVTLYASSGDRALMASKAFHGYPRAGDSGAGLIIVPGVETIDASENAGGLLGHSYFAEDRRIMEDIYAILVTGLRADKRFALQPVDTAQGRYWSFRR